MAKHVVTVKMIVTANDWEAAESGPYMVNKIPGMEHWLLVTSTHWEEEIEDEDDSLAYSLPRWEPFE